MTISTRINRYIMECKLEENGMSLINEFELIDTLWNVNILNNDICHVYLLELIDTLWNVNPPLHLQKHQ